MAAKGHRPVGKSFVKLVLAIDPDTFEEIREISIRKNESTAATCRDLLEWGLENTADDALTDLR
jgi:hypothetical protein